MSETEYNGVMLYIVCNKLGKICQCLQYQAAGPLLEISAAFRQDDLMDLKFSMIYFDDCIGKTVLTGLEMH